MLKFGNTILLRNTNWLGNTPGAPLPPEPPDYNPLNLPPFTARLLFMDGSVPEPDRRRYPINPPVYTQVSVSPNIWDVYYPKPDWELLLTSLDGQTKICDDQSEDLLEILGANTEGVLIMSRLTTNCHNLRKTALFDTRNAIEAHNMFRNCYALDDVPNFDFTEANDIHSLYYGCTSLKNLPDTLLIPKAGDVRDLFHDCSALTKAPFMDFSTRTGDPNIDYSGYLSFMFTNCTSLVEVPYYDFTHILSLEGMFAGCTSLETVPLYDMSNVTNTTGMFQKCTSFKEVPFFNLSRVYDCRYMFGECINIKEIPPFNLSAAAITEGMFDYCVQLDYIPNITVTRVRSCSDMFDGCFKVRYGALDMYNRFMGQTTNPSNHTFTFRDCGRDTVTGAAELKKIPRTWKTSVEY